MWVWVGLVWRICVGLGGVGFESLRGSVWVGLKSLCRFGWGWFGVCVGLGGVGLESLCGFGWGWFGESV